MTSLPMLFAQTTQPQTVSIPGMEWLNSALNYGIAGLIILVLTVLAIKFTPKFIEAVKAVADAINGMSNNIAAMTRTNEDFVGELRMNREQHREALTNIQQSIDRQADRIENVHADVREVKAILHARKE